MKRSGSGLQNWERVKHRTLLYNHWQPLLAPGVPRFDKYPEDNGRRNRPDGTRGELPFETQKVLIRSLVFDHSAGSNQSFDDYQGPSPPGGRCSRHSNTWNSFRRVSVSISCKIVPTWESRVWGDVRSRSLNVILVPDTTLLISVDVNQGSTYATSTKDPFITGGGGPNVRPK